MPSRKDVASVAGVSIATVSNFINDPEKVAPATRKRIEGAIAKVGFTGEEGERGLSKGKSGKFTSPSNSESESKSVDDPRIGSLSRPQSIEGQNVGSTSGVAKYSTATSAPTARLLLRILRAAQPISRIELARRLDLNRSTVSEVFTPLIAAGIVREEALSNSDSNGRPAGRPPVGLAMNADHDYFVGVNLGVRRSQVGLTTIGGCEIAEDEFNTASDPDAAMDMIRESIGRLCKLASGRRLRVIGVSVPGPADPDRTRLVYAPHLGWRDVAVAEALRFSSDGSACAIGNGVPVIVENDATAAAMYEAMLRRRNSPAGALKDFVLVRSGTGIGVGLVLGGEVYRGTGKGEGIAGEFGHMTIVAGGKPCVCGNRGCWERYAAASAAPNLYMGERVQLGGMKAPRYAEIVARAESGEIRAQRTLEQIGMYLGIGISNVITGFGVPNVILSGRVVHGWKFIQGPLREAIDKSMAGKLSGWSVEPGEPSGAGLGGALEVAAEEYLMSCLAV
jgi:predicted NBD/HSP70 family sugar kinase/DNA-binding transcriptional ArsR family regulator